MPINLDTIYLKEFPTFSNEPSYLDAGKRSMVSSAETSLFALMVLGHEGHKVANLLDIAQSELNIAYQHAEVAKGVKTADALVDRFMKGADRVITAKFGRSVSS